MGENYNKYNITQTSRIHNRIKSSILSKFAYINTEIFVRVANL